MSFIILNKSLYRKTLRIKAANHQIKTELYLMKAQTDSLLNQIQTIKNRDTPDIKRDTSKVLDTIVSLII
jgi:uncharacterized protein YegP (UPF0339 family)